MMESLLYITVSAFVIGVFISAPMGPVGMLVIQRTLSKGRMAAFYTGVGAALSDLIYCLLSGLGLSLVTDFIEQNKNVLQLIGSAVIILYAIFLYRTDPTKSVTRRQVSQSNNFLRDFVTGFLFTVSNPLILFFIIGLFARFNFMDSHYTAIHYALGFLFIVLGALTWWFLITWFVNKVRGRFTNRTILYINRVMAILLTTMALMGIYNGIKALTQ